MEPLDMISPASQDKRRTSEFPEKLVTYLSELIRRDITPREIVTRDSIRNALIVSMAVGGSTNVLLHAPEIARAAGYEIFSEDIMSPEELGVDMTPTVEVLSVEPPAEREAGIKVESIEELVDKLKNEAKVIS